MGTRVTVKGQVTLPKAARDAAGIRPGDIVEVRARLGGGLIVEKAAEAAPDEAAIAAARKRIDRALAELDRKKVTFSMTSDEWMRLMRDDD